MEVAELREQLDHEIREQFDALIADGMDPYLIFKMGYIANEAPSGNQYSGYLKENNLTWAKVKIDEPVFILRGQDVTAPEIVMAWIAKNLDTVEEHKIKEAFQTVLAMRRYDSRRDPT